MTSPDPYTEFVNKVTKTVTDAIIDLIADSIVIEVEGGCVQSVTVLGKEVACEIVDHDVEDYEDDEELEEE